MMFLILFRELAHTTREQRAVSTACRPISGRYFVYSWTRVICTAHEYGYPKWHE